MHCNMIKSKLYDIQDDFNFPIVNYTFLDSNIAKGPTYGVSYYLPNNLFCKCMFTCQRLLSLFIIVYSTKETFTPRFLE